MFRLSFNPVGDASYLLVGICALVLLGLLVLGPGRARVDRKKRAALLAVRGAIIVLVILAMLRPTVVYVETKKQSATLVVLADKSRSMSVPDEVNGNTRWQALARTLEGAQNVLEAFDRDFELKAYTFDTEPHPIEVVDGQFRLPEVPDGEQTAIGATLQDVLRQQAGKRLLGIVLLSDGSQRARPPRDVLPQTAAGLLKSSGVPLHTFRFGRSRGLGQAQDVAVEKLVANPRVFVKNELSVMGQIRIDGYVNREIPVQLLMESDSGEMEPVAQKNVQVTAEGGLVPVQFAYTPQMPGEYKLAIEAVGQPGELVTTNNRMSTFVEVLKGGLNILYLEGVPRWEAKHVRWALDASPDINVDYAWLNPRSPTAGTDDERFTPGKYEVYVLGDLDASSFEPAELTSLAENVSRGAGLIMLGGFQSFGPGGYAKTPLADVLPVRMDTNERQNPGERIRTDMHWQGLLKMVPSPIGLQHFTLMLGANPGENRAIWSELPLLDGANRFGRIKPGALVLAEAEQGQPLLIAQEYGRGRVMAFAGDTTWRWWMHGHADVHRRFWRQMVLWLARKDDSAEGNVWIELAQRRFSPGRRVEFVANAQTSTGQLVEDAQYEARIAIPDGATRSVRLTRRGDRMVGSFSETQTSGDYAIEVTAKQGGQTLGTARARFVVFAQDLEIDSAAADSTMLDNLAAMTGGRSLAPEELPELIAQLTEATEDLEVSAETKRSLWDTWFLFLLLIGLLGVEWYLRKRWGLV